MRKTAILLLVIVFASCVRNKNVQIPQQANNGKSFEVAEVIQGGTYTYIKVKENDAEKWMAITKQEVDKGGVYYYDNALQMNNFTSKEINRTFDEIYFVNAISKTPFESATMENAGAMGGAMGNMAEAPAHSGKVDVEQNSTINLKKSAGEISVAQVYSNRAGYEGKEIEIRGLVVKVNKEVMGKNWIHIQDGTSDNGNFDLTVTSNELAEVNDEITVRGKIVLNKDFGYGYSYEVIMEDAKIVNSKSAGAEM